MFNITSNMLLEGTNSLFSDVRIANSQITNENYFDTALESAKSIEAEYTEAKAKLYNGLASSTKEFKDMFSKAYERSFPGKDKKSVNESCTSTEHFISYFGKSVEILNKAAGNIADACCGICNQAPVAVKEAAKTLGTQKKSDLCPVCKGEPCTCKKREQLFKFTTDHGINITDFNFPAMDAAVAGKDSFQKLYDSMVVEAADVAAKRRATISGLPDQMIDVSTFGEAVISNFRSTNRYPVMVSHRYLDYCIETVNSYQERVEEVKAEAKRVAASIREAANKVANVMTASSTMEYIKEDGNTLYLEDEEQVQNMDLYCKAKVDELVAACQDHIISIGAKLDAMKCEFDQCKAVLSKYVCGNDEPTTLPVPADDDDDSNLTASDALSNGDSTIQEEPGEAGTPDEPDPMDSEYESYMPGGTDFYTDTRDMEDYRESYESFLIDMISHEATLTSYINGEVLAESDQVFVEGAIGKTKGLLHRIGEFIKKIWGKFTNAMAGLFQNDQKYLSKNENTIKNVKPKSAKVDQWYNYNRDRIAGEAGILSKVNQEMDNLINPTKLLSSMNQQIDPTIKECGDTQKGLANAFVKYFKQCDNPKENNTKDKFRTYFRGYPISINANTLTDQERTQMYDYCFNFKQGVQDVLQKDIDTINEMQSAADSAMQQLMDAVEKNEANMKQKQQEEKEVADKAVKDGEAGMGKEVQNMQKQQQDQKTAESSDMASVLDDFFSEANFGTPQENPPKNGNTQGMTATNAVKGSENVDKINQNQQAANQSIATSRDQSNTKANAEIVERYVSNVFNLAKDYTSVKLSMAENAYKQYMQFFRWHVGQYAGTDQQQQQGGDNIDTSQATVNNNGGNGQEQQGNEQK